MYVNLFLYCLFVLFFGEEPQAVAYSAQPLWWSGWETSSPTTHRGAVRKDGAEIPWGGYRLFGTASMLEWLSKSSPTTHRGAVRKDGIELPWGGYRLFGTASMFGWLRNYLPHHSQGSSTERWSRNTLRMVTATVFYVTRGPLTSPLIFNNSVETAAPFNVVSHPRCCEPRN